jgi:hypothetical protein
MKVGDLIRLPQEQGYAIALKIIKHDNDPNMPTGDTSVMVIQEWGEDWWDTNCCEVVNESR